jgi:hypothetical protein
MRHITFASTLLALCFASPAQAQSEKISITKDDLAAAITRSCQAKYQKAQYVVTDFGMSWDLIRQKKIDEEILKPLSLQELTAFREKTLYYIREGDDLTGPIDEAVLCIIDALAPRFSQVQQQPQKPKIFQQMSRAYGAQPAPPSAGTTGPVIGRRDGSGASPQPAPKTSYIPLPQAQQPETKSRIIAGNGKSAMGCAQLVTLSNDDPRIAPGGRVIANNCGEKIEIAWCYVDRECGQQGGGSQWTLGAGRSWPVSKVREIRWAACIGANTIRFEEGSAGSRFLCFAPTGGPQPKAQLGKPLQSGGD